MHLDIRHELAQIGRQIHGGHILRELETCSISERLLLTVLRQNRALLDAARQIVRNCDNTARTPLFQERKPNSVSDLLEEVAGMGQLMRAIDSAMELALRTNNMDESWKRGVDLLMLGNAIRNGGCELDAFLGLCCEGFAVAGLRRIRVRLAADCPKQVVELLDRHSRHREPFEQIWRRDSEWARVVDSANTRDDSSKLEIHGLPGIKANEIRNAVTAHSIRSEREKYELSKRNDDRSLAQIRLLMTEVAVLWHRRLHGGVPDSLDQLCPALLPELPADPFSGRSLVYRRTDGTFVVYSVGDKGYDSGGLLVPLNDVAAGRGDLFLEAEGRISY